ncbi:MAG: NAD(P)/FAD-dependent oxidoreductase [Woeseia sp.]
MNTANRSARFKLSPGSTIGVIGAGIAGLCTAKVLQQFGFEVTVIEKEAELGGVWAASRRYPGLTTQNPRSTYEFSDFPMPRHYPEWPRGEQVQAYLEAYAKHFGIFEKIILNAEVRQAAIDTAEQHWTVKVQSSRANPQEDFRELVFDYLVVCNGIFSEPFIPDFAGSERFRGAGGRICHSSQFTRVDEARGKNVVVVGYGKSSCDVANATVDLSRHTYLVARHLIWKIPKKLKNVLNFKYLFLTRMGEALFRYIRVKGFEKFLHGSGLPIRNFMLGQVERMVAKQLTLHKLGLHPGMPLETIARSTVSLVTDGFYDNIRAGRLTVKRAEIVELHAGCATLSNGDTIPTDIVICGTGWRQETPFFDNSVMANVTDERGNFRLYRSMIPVGAPRLAFNGYNSSFFSQLNAEIGALWIAGHLLNAFKLPSKEVMNKAVDERLIWMEQRTEGKHSKGTNIIPFSIHHMDELLSDLRLTLNAFRRFRQWLIPVTGADYRPITARLLRRQGFDSRCSRAEAQGGHSLKGSES